MGSHRILSSKTNVLAYLDCDHSYDCNTVIVQATGSKSTTWQHQISQCFDCRFVPRELLAKWSTKTYSYKHCRFDKDCFLWHCASR